MRTPLQDHACAVPGWAVALELWQAATVGRVRQLRWYLSPAHRRRSA